MGAAEGVQPRATILVVEDNQANLNLVRALLRRSPYLIVAAGSAEEARERLGEAHPDLVLMDLNLPGISGLELTRRLKADPETAGIPVIAVTAYAMEGDRARALAAGCDGYLAKPLDAQDFRQEVDAVLRRGRLQTGGE